LKLGKNKDERRLEQLSAEKKKISESINHIEYELLNEKFLRNASLQEVIRLKGEHYELMKRSDKLTRSINRLTERLS
jgi:archaellum component FlaC